MKKSEQRMGKILTFVQRYTAEKGYSPTVREIAEAAGLKSTAGAHQYLKKLEENGYISLGSGKSRAIALNRSAQSVEIPLIGNVAAGVPILAEQNIEEYVFVPRSLVSGGECYMLKVSGDSMVNAGILNGDRVIVRSQSTAENGEIVVALLDDSATVKRFFKEKGAFRLQPENDGYPPILLSDVTILGKVVGLFRKLG